MNMEHTPGRTVTVAAEPVGSPVTERLLRGYLAEMIVRHFGRPTTDTEMDSYLPEHASDHLVPPAARFLLARCDGEPAGCAGVRLLDGGRDAELTRMYVSDAYRGLGVGGRLLATAEEVAREMGARRMVLDTRKDLTEAHTLYRRHGFAESPAHNSGEFREMWFTKSLARQGAVG